MIHPDKLRELGLAGENLVFTYPEPLEHFEVHCYPPPSGMARIKKDGSVIKVINTMYEVKQFYNKVAGYNIEDRHEYLPK